MNENRESYATPSARHSLYFCPGEELPISWSVHLARLAAFYPPCLECPLRHQTGHLPWRELESPGETARPSRRTSLISECGIRGVYLNELNRFHAAGYVNSFVRWLADASRDRTPGNALSLAVGYQEHPSSPDLSVGVVNALRASGVRIVDVGLTVGPLISQAIAECGLDGGVLVTGSGCHPAWIGLDFLVEMGRPLNDPAALSSIEAGRDAPTYRLRDGQGGYRTFDPAPSHFADLSSRFHALRPLRVAVATPIGFVAELLERLFEPLPCSLEPVALPRRKRELQNPGDSDLQKLGEAVRAAACHLGFLIDDDARSAAVLDERGELVPFSQWSRLLGNSLPEIDTRSERIWETAPLLRCDAVLTLAHLLTILSHSDRELSERVSPELSDSNRVEDQRSG
jgi:phosphomannomutase